MAAQPRRSGQRAASGAARPPRHVDRLGRRHRLHPLRARTPTASGCGPCPLSAQDYEEYYEGYANSTLWPLYHDAVETPAFHRRWWEAYQRVNRRFAQADRRLRRARLDGLDPGLPPAAGARDAARTPARPAHRLLHAHPVPAGRAVHAAAARGPSCCGACSAPTWSASRPPFGAENFTRLAARLLGPVTVDGTRRGLARRPVRGAGAFPISIDVGEMEELGRNPDVIERAAALRADLGDPARVILGVDRLDYTKGIEHRIKAYRELLVDGRIKVQDTVMVQVAVPSRERVEHYRILRDKVEREVGRINGEFGRVGVPAVHYLNQSFDRAEVAALYHAADVMAVTPLRDGMNLVAKEYIAARVDNGGALVPQRVHRRRRRAARVVPGQPARPGRSQGHAGTGAGGAGRREPGSDAGHAPPRARPRRPGVGPRYLKALEQPERPVAHALRSGSPRDATHQQPMPPQTDWRLCSRRVTLASDRPMTRRVTAVTCRDAGRDTSVPYRAVNLESA